MDQKSGIPSAAAASARATAFCSPERRGESCEMMEPSRGEADSDSKVRHEAEDGSRDEYGISERIIDSEEKEICFQ